jgi:tetratricopeptide (TPR) repeat protein
MLKHFGTLTACLVLLAACAQPSPHKISDITEAQDLSDRALGMFAAGDLNGALSALNAVVAFGSIDDAVYARRAAVYGTMKHYDKALTDANRAIDLAPRTWRHYLERAVIYQRTGQFAAAITDLDRAVALQPDEIGPLRRRAYLKVVAGRFDDAIADYETLTESFPRRDTGVLGRGAALYLAGRWREAAGQFSDMLDNQPDDGLAALWLTKSRLRAGEIMTWEELGSHADDGPEWRLARLLLGGEDGKPITAHIVDVEPCERALFLGLWHILHRGNTSAIQAFQAAGQACPRDSIEASEARVELARLRAHAQSD